MVDKSLPQIRGESGEVVGKISEEPLSERICEKHEVIDVTETAIQDRSLQRTVERAFGDFVEVGKTIPRERISGRMYERIEVIEVPMIPSKESVEIDKK